MIFLFLALVAILFELNDFSCFGSESSRQHSVKPESNWPKCLGVDSI